jgi:hypothetical protein
MKMALLQVNTSKLPTDGAVITKRVLISFDFRKISHLLTHNDKMMSTKKYSNHILVIKQTHMNT